MKKVLSLVLVIAMVLSSMSFAFASTFEDVADSDYEVAIETMKALGVINGYPDGTFRPEGILTRAELAKLLVEALGFGGLAGGASNFSDTKAHWADGYIAIASGMGLVNGYPDGTFKPEATVSYEEAYTMVIRALGYTDASLRGVWPTNYMVKALDLGLTKNLALTTGPADRGGVAQVLYNALDAKFVIVDADNNITPVAEGAKTLIDRLGTEKALEVSVDNLDPEDKAYKGNVVDLAPYMYQKLTVYENKDGDVVYVKSVDSLVVEAKVVSFASNKLEVKYNDKNYTGLVTTGAAFFVNEGEGTLALAKDDVVTLVLDADSDAKLAKDMSVVGIVARIVTEEELVVDEYIDGDLILEGYKLPVDDDEVDFDKLVVTGDIDSIEDIEENDVVEFYYAGGKEADDVKLEIHVTRNSVEGKVTRISGSNYYVNGTAYKLRTGVSLVLGTEYELFLDSAGKVFAAQEVGTGTTTADYAIVIEKSNGLKYTQGTESATIRDAKVKLLTAEGKKVTYVVNDSVTGSAFGFTKATLTFADEATVGQLIKYELNDDGEVDVADLVTTQSANNLKTTGNSFNLVSDAVIFNTTGANDVTLAKVIKVADLGDKITSGVKFEGTKGIEVIVVYGQVTTADEIYAVLTGIATIIDPDDDDKTAIEYSFFIDGEKVTYDGKAGAAALRSVDGKLVKLTITDGRLTAMSPVTTNTVTGEAGSARVSTEVTLTTGDAGKYYLSDDVIVYVYDGDDVTLGAKSNIRLNEVVLYNIDAANTDDYGVVIVIE